MKDLKYYRANRLSCPDIKDYTTFYVYSKGKVVFEGNYDQYKGNIPFPNNALVEKVVNEQELANHQLQYREEEKRLYNEFKSDIFELFGVDNNPKKEKVFSLAWGYGLPSGYEEIYKYFGDLVELIKD